MKVSESKHPRYPWRVHWKEGVKVKNRFFASKKVAERFAQHKRQEIGHIAPSQVPPDAGELRALEEARLHKVPLMEAVNLWRKSVGEKVSRTFADFIDARLASAKKDAITDRHRKGVERVLTKAREQLGGLQGDAITPQECQAFIAQWPGHSSQKQVRAILGSAFTHAMGQGWTQFNPAGPLKLAKRPHKDTIAIFTVDEAAEWLCCVAAHAPSCLAGWAIALFAGLRWAEIDRLDWSRVKMGRGFIEVTAGTAKTRTRRLVDIQPNLMEILSPLAQTQGRVFPLSPRRAERWAEKAYSRDIPKNAARHSFVSYHLALFGDVNLTELQAGHDRKVLFQHYRELVTNAEAESYFSMAL